VKIVEYLVNDVQESLGIIPSRIFPVIFATSSHPQLFGIYCCQVKKIVKFN
jgi:hypothetical protein